MKKSYLSELEVKLIQAVARGWCHPKNEEKEVDIHLAEAIVKEVLKVISVEMKKEKNKSFEYGFIEGSKPDKANL